MLGHWCLVNLAKITQQHYLDRWTANRFRFDVQHLQVERNNRIWRQLKQLLGVGLIQLECIGYYLLRLETLPLEGKNIDNLGFRNIGFVQFFKQFAGVDLG